MYSNPTPVGAVIVTVPVATAQVGNVVTLAVGAAGANGANGRLTTVAVETQVLSVVLLVKKL